MDAYMDDHPRPSLDTCIWTPGCRSIPWVSAIVKALEAPGIVSLQWSQPSEAAYVPVHTLSVHERGSASGTANNSNISATLSSKEIPAIGCDPPIPA